MAWKRYFVCLWIITVFSLLIACIPLPSATTSPTVSPTPTPTSPSPTPSPSPSPTVGPAKTQYQLEYLLLAKYPDFFWCDPDFYPIAREGQEQVNAIQQFSTIRSNSTEFSAILEHLGILDKADYTDAEKLSIYREHKKLTYALQVTASGNIYQFTLRIGQNQGFRVTGTITPTGQITETQRESSFNTCPICLAKGTLIDTPTGLLPVEQIQEGMTVWTLDEAGNRVAGTVIETHMTPVPPSFQVVKVTLNDGRTDTASPGHPTADLKALGDYQIGDTLDGAKVTSVERLVYDWTATYDILPSGATGLYWANGVLLLSTLK